MVLRFAPKFKFTFRGEEYHPRHANPERRLLPESLTLRDVRNLVDAGKVEQIMQNEVRVPSAVDPVTLARQEIPTDAPKGTRKGGKPAPSLPKPNAEA